MAPACLDVPPSFKEYDVSSSSPVPSSSLADRATPTYPATLPPHDSALYCIYPCNNGPGCKETTSSSTFLSYRPQDIYIYTHTPTSFLLLSLATALPASIPPTRRNNFHGWRASEHCFCCDVSNSMLQFAIVCYSLIWLLDMFFLEFVSLDLVPLMRKS